MAVLACVRLVASLKWSSSTASGISRERGLDVRGVQVLPASARRPIQLAACAPLAWLAWPLARQAASSARAPCPRDRRGAPAMASTPTSPAPGDAAPVATGLSRSPGAAPGRSCRRRCCEASPRWPHALCAPVGALTCVLRKPRAARGWLFTEPAGRVGRARRRIHADARGTGAAHRSGRGSSISSSTAACTLPAPTNPCGAWSITVAAWRRATAVKWSRSSASASSNVARTVAAGAGECSTSGGHGHRGALREDERLPARGVEVGDEDLGLPGRRRRRRGASSSAWSAGFGATPMAPSGAWRT